MSRTEQRMLYIHLQDPLSTNYHVPFKIQFEEGIDVVLDHWRILEIFMGITPEQMRKYCTVVPQGILEHPSGWVAYRRSRDAEIKTPGVSAAPGETVPAAPLLSGE